MSVSGKFVTAERFILRPLSAICGIGGGAYLFSGDWFVGIFLLVIAFFIGVIGQGLPHHKGKTFQQLTQGSAADPDQFEDDLDMSPEETTKMGRVAMFTGLCVGLAAWVVSSHHGLAWYLCFPVGIIVAIAIGALVGVCIIKTCPRKGQP